MNGNNPKAQPSQFVPALFLCIKEGMTFRSIRQDILAGLTVAIVALPLAMAMAVASGASPDKGLVTAVVAGFFISFLGGSRVQIGGPTGAFVVVIFDVISNYGFDGLIVASVMAGIILVVAGYMKLGKLIKYIPYPVITGFTTGIAVIIASSQVKDFLGFTFSVPADFLGQWQTYLSNLGSVSPFALGTGVVSFLLILLCKKISAKLPAYLISIVIVSLVVFIFNLPVETIGTRFPNMPDGLPMPQIPTVDIDTIRMLIPSAFTIAFLAGIEALLSAVVADGMTGHKHSLNQELVGQGVANIASGLFGGLPATGAIARTATNIKSGGSTPISGICHALFLLVFLYTIMDILSYIPMAALAGVLFMVAWGMSDLKHFISIAKISPSDRTILFLTFALTVLVDLTVAIGVGVTFASLLFMRHMSRSIEITPQSNVSEFVHNDGDYDRSENITLPEGVAVFQVNGPLFFGVASELYERLKALEVAPRILILRMRFMPYLDASGEAGIEDLIKFCRLHHTYLILSAVRSQPKRLLEKAGVDQNPEIALTIDYERAVELARKLMADPEFVSRHSDPMIK